jgi:hypothetical protein
MNKWKLLSVMLLTGVALLLMTSMVAAAPAAANGVHADRMNDDPIVTGTVPMTQPVAAAIAAYFNISYTEVISLHEAGYGFGVIARVYLTALRSNGALTPTQLLGLFQSGMGWGQIMKQYGVHPGGNGLGSIMRQQGAPAPVVPQPAVQPPVSHEPRKSENSGSATCPGNSCNAPGHNKGPKK